MASPRVVAPFVALLLLAAAQAPAAADDAGRPLIQLAGLFNRAPAVAPASSPAAAAGDPLSIAPPVQPDLTAATPTFSPVPKPRLRPAATAKVVATVKPDPAPVVRKVDPTVTGAVDPGPPPVPSAAVPPPTIPTTEPAPQPAVTVVIPAPSAPPDPGVAADGLLGDPSTTFKPSTADAAPVAPAPQTIALPRPPASAADSVPAQLGDASAPYQLIRELQALQDQTANGSVEALAMQRSLIGAIDQAFAAADAGVWREPRNAVAAVAFVLSGGPPTILQKLAGLDPKPPVDDRLVSGVLAYAEGREMDAATELGPIDAINLPPTIAAEVAMAQSALAARTDPQLAMRLLSLARLLAPGTLVEEAAIRRQIFVADQLRDDKAVQSLARQYLDRFRHSVYAGNFRDRFAAALSHMDFVNDPAQFPRLDDMLASVEPAARTELYLTIALAGVVNGRLNAGRLAATRALDLSAQGTPGQSRARLYRAAALVASAKTFDAAVSDYVAVDTRLLSPSDQGLSTAVAAAIAAVRSGTEAKVAPLPAATSADPAPPDPVVTRATDALTSVDALLAAAASL
jgi:chemotaxis protein MotC